MAYFSIEGYFQRLRSSLAGRLEVQVVLLPFISRGFFRRLVNLLFTCRLRSTICHVTGDVHYVCLALPRRLCLL
ncbi:MAG: hypothetical protein ACKPJJ_24105, partial [Planctomycetaceae bacterium]